MSNDENEGLREFGVAGNITFAEPRLAVFSYLIFSRYNVDIFKIAIEHLQVSISMECF